MKVAYVSQVLAFLAAVASRRIADAAADEYPAHMAKLMNLDVDPCEDFYQYACGSWVKETELPPEKSSVSYSFGNVQDRSNEVLKKIVESGAATVSELFQSCLNTDTLDQLGVKPIEANLKRIQETKTTEDVMKLAGELRLQGMGFITDGDVSAHTKNAAKNAFFLSGGSISLPDKSYYLDADNWTKFEPALTEYVSTLFSLAGLEDAAAKAAKVVIDVEQQLAKVWLPKTWYKNPANTYNPMTLEQALKDYPLTIGAYLTGTGALSAPALKPTTEVINYAKPLLDGVEKAVSGLTVEDLRTYLTYRWLNDNAQSLTTKFQAAWFKLYRTALYGVPKPAPRWKKCVGTVSTQLPDLMGKYYFEKMSSPAAEQTAKDMVQYIEEAMKENINHVEWLDAETRLNALKKLSKVTNLIGHSEHVEEFDFPIKTDAFLENVNNIAGAKYKKMLTKIGGDVDKTEWGMSASDANAYYSRSFNQMVFPIGIFQNPFFDPAFPTAENFGSIGAVVGHELTHGFDSGGRLYDGDGNQNAWWSDSAGTEFDARADCMKAQYSSFEVVGEAGTVIAHVNGNTTITENIADNGGIKLAFHTYHAFVKDHLQRRLQQQQQKPKKDLCGEDNSSPAITPAKGGAQTNGQTGTTPAPGNNGNNGGNNGGSSTPAGGANNGQAGSPAPGKGGNNAQTGAPTPSKGGNPDQSSTPAPSKGGNAGQTSAPTPSKGGNPGQTSAPSPSKTVPVTPVTPTPTATKPVNGSSSGSGSGNGSIVFPTATPTAKPTSTPTSTPVAGGSKDDKIFFVAYAQTWCSKYRDAAVKNLIATDPHTPSMWRVNGVVMNNEDFAKTFQCAANKPMNPTKKCIVW